MHGKLAIKVKTNIKSSRHSYFPFFASCVSVVVIADDVLGIVVTPAAARMIQQVSLTPPDFVAFPPSLSCFAAACPLSRVLYFIRHEAIIKKPEQLFATPNIDSEWGKCAQVLEIHRILPRISRPGPPAKGPR